MRLKAKMTKDNMLQLHVLLASFERISAKAALHLTPKTFKISLITESVDTPQCFAEMGTDDLFQEYKIQSQSDNAILFEIGLDLLSWALASGKAAEHGVLKLVKRGTKPFLCFEAYAQSAATMKVLHDIPIRILQATNIVYYMPPLVAPPTVSLKLPRGKMMRTVIEKLNKFSKNVVVTASQTGRLVFRVEHASVTIKTFFTNLTPFYPSNLHRDTDAKNSATIKLDVKKLSAILNLHLLSWDDACIFIVNNATVLIELAMPAFGGGVGGADGGSISFYIPVLLLNREDELEYGQEAEMV